MKQFIAGVISVFAVFLFACQKRESKISEERTEIPQSPSFDHRPEFRNLCESMRSCMVQLIDSAKATERLNVEWKSSNPKPVQSKWWNDHEKEYQAAALNAEAALAEISRIRETIPRIPPVPADLADAHKFLIEMQVSLDRISRSIAVGPSHESTESKAITLLYGDLESVRKNSVPFAANFERLDVMLPHD